MKLLALVTLAILITACGGAERKEEHRQKADAFFQQGDFEKARLEYKNVVLIDPKDLQGHFRLAETQEKLGNLPTAVGEYRNVLILDEANIPAKVGLGYLYAMAGVSEAAQFADEILAAQPDNVDGLVIRSMLAARAGQMDDAMADANRALSLDSGHIKASILLSSLHLQAEQPEDAERVINPLLAQYPQDLSLLNQLARITWKQSRHAETIEALKKTLELQPDNLSQYVFLSGVQLKQGDKAGAQQTLEAAIAALPEKLDPKLMLVDFLLKERGPQDAEKRIQSFLESDDDWDLQLALASLYEKTGQTDKAVSTYEGIVKGDATMPATLTSRNRLALIYLKQKKQPEAEEMLAKVLEENPKDQEALMLRGRLALAGGEPDKAINDFRAVLKQSPESVEIRRLLARAQESAGNMELALLNLQKAAEVEPTNDAIQIDMAKMHVRMKQEDRAREVLRDLLRKDPGNVEASKTMVALQLQDQDPSGAMATVHKLQEKEPDSAYGHYLEGRLHQANKDFAKSNASLEQALLKQPGAIEPLVSLVTNYLYEKNTVGARRVLDRALSENPNHVVARNLLGEIQMSAGQLAEAESTFRQVLGVKSDWWVPYRNLASLKMRLGKKAEAVEVMKAGVDANPDSVRLRMELALLQSTVGDRAAAVGHYEWLLQKDPENIAVRNNLAMVLTDESASDADLKKALELSLGLPEDNPMLLDTKSWVSFRNGDTSLAKVLAEKGLALLPDSPDLHFHYGLMLESQGDVAGAKVHLRRSIEVGGRGFADLNAAKERLAALESKS